jgi:hypothetical protein
VLDSVFLLRVGRGRGRGRGREEEWCLYFLGGWWRIVRGQRERESCGWDECRRVVGAGLGGRIPFLSLSFSLLPSLFFSLTSDCSGNQSQQRGGGLWLNSREGVSCTALLFSAILVPIGSMLTWLQCGSSLCATHGDELAVFRVSSEWSVGRSVGRSGR